MEIALSRDRIQKFWWKRFTNIHQSMNQFLNDYLTIGKVPTWFAEEWTTLVVKKKTKDLVVGNFWPIGCLNLLCEATNKYNI